MAKIVLGLASSHTPQLSIPGDQWPLLQKKDESDPRIDYASLLERAKPGIEAELTIEKFRERDASCQRALDDLKKVLNMTAPDVLVVIGDDQHEQFHDDNMPMFCVYRGESMPARGRNGAQGRDPSLGGMATNWQQATQEREGDTRDSYPACPELAEHVIGSLVEDGFDISVSNQLRKEAGVGHAFSFLHRRLLTNHDIPMLPIMINTFYPPNAPTARRSYALGQALRTAVESWDSNQRVAIVASGGLSHVIIDEELDESLIDALLKKDAGRLQSFPADRMTLGTSENRNWIALGGAMEPMDMLLAEYLPCYRSPAGTGCGMGFAYWM